ncbi:hypothetical protein HOC99_00240 [Candidatus Woesearchaeota archaeon]|jgi:hypothetical protein|nr:hypothetical protein [Candidatus Woesearchaeota archaeon]MBT4388000.1 hypothetical protein [Candidatus Woesearchaeota archaeon]MBT4595344.1 hypothetical protein [Candidatus Woesearchaeota archaeon]MBT5741251.1 hypothetical protein [Candidatus Woesearchaeota archaeon]MBT7296568.1 hypothetical protein [Candidatus Woesearchaeota archaeon]
MEQNNLPIISHGFLKQYRFLYYNDCDRPVFDYINSSSIFLKKGAKVKLSAGLIDKFNLDFESIKVGVHFLPKWKENLVEPIESSIVNSQIDFYLKTIKPSGDKIYLGSINGPSYNGFENYQKHFIDFAKSCLKNKELLDHLIEQYKFKQELDKPFN